MWAAIRQFVADLDLWTLTKQTVVDYFRPLRQWWFWLIVFPIVIALAVYMTYLEDP